MLTTATVCPLPTIALEILGAFLAQVGLIKDLPPVIGVLAILESFENVINVSFSAHDFISCQKFHNGLTLYFFNTQKIRECI
jgi:hypothetical protein